MATFNKYEQFVTDLCSGVHQFQTGTTHVLKVMLSSTAPNAATHTVRANASEITAQGGYVSGGVSVGTITGTETSGVFKVVGATDPVFTATDSTFPLFRYSILYNDTPTSPADPLIGWWDYGSTVTLAQTETFTVDLDQVSGMFTLG